MELPPREQERLAALTSYEILDTEAEEAFDQIARLAGTVFQAPFAFISFVDDRRQWFKSCLGAAMRETARDDPFCRLLLETGQPVLAGDAQADERFSGSDWVRRWPGIRFYAGAPVMAGGRLAVGAISVCDQKPRRPLLESETLILRQLAEMIAQQLEARRRVAGYRRAEEALRESEGKFRSLAEAIPHMVWTTGAGGHLEYCNGRTLDYLGVRPGSLQTSWADSLHPDQRDAAIERWEAAIRRGSQYYDEVRLRRAADGEYRWHLNRAVPVYDESLSVRHWFGTSTDIHDKKTFEERLVKANEDLKQFAYAASHDLQEPIRAVATHAQLLERRYRDQFRDPKALEVLDNMIEGARRIRALVLDLLAYTEIGMPNLIKNEPVDSNEALDEAIRGLEPEIRACGAKLSAGRLPTLRGVRAHLAQLFQNLVSNAIKYRSDRPLRISVSAKQEQDMWIFRFADNGIGIAPEYQRRIFGVFKRLHGREIPGTGMGLAICQKIIERNGGEMWVESQPGSGSVFYFTWPASPAEESG
ncbi:MAG: PAS domain-containing protein [Bryobacteraceae bacterium]|nr:PAS domain-containing protein [Bryobacteraceae bacterium]